MEDDSDPLNCDQLLVPKMEIEDEEISKNPWDVDNLDIFCAYNCPECPYRHENKSEFQEHAISTHEKVRNIRISSFSSVLPISSIP